MIRVICLHCGVDAGISGVCECGPPSPARSRLVEVVMQAGALHARRGGDMRDAIREVMDAEKEQPS